MEMNPVVQSARGLSPESAQIPIEILLVDDREENLLALEAVLESPDYRLVKVQSGDLALRYLLDHAPALIVMDVQMPGLDGFETAAIIKGGARTREIPIIFITALNKDERYLYKGYQFGAVDYLYKPFDAQILRSKVAVFADLHRKNEKLLRTERLLRENETRERERRIAELELKSLRREQVEQRRYRQLVQGINHGIVWQADPQSLAITFVSDSSERLTGFSATEWTESPDFFLEHLHPEDRDAFREAAKLALNENVEGDIEHRFLTASGEMIWLQTGLRATTNPTTLEVELSGLSVDITKLKDAERAARQNRQRSELLAQASLILGESFDYGKNLDAFASFAAKTFADFIAVDLTAAETCLTVAASGRSAGKDGRNLVQQFHENPRDAEMQLGSSRAQLLLELTGPALKEAAGSPERLKGIQGMGFSSLIFVGLTARGRQLGTLLLGTVGEARKFNQSDAYFVEDLAYRVASAVDNSLLFIEAQNAVKVRDEFLAIASHELRTPLTPLKLHAQQLMRSIQKKGLAGLSQESLTRMVATTNRQVERLSKLIDSLLDITRISRGKLTLTPTEFLLGDMVADVIARLHGEMELAGCTFSSDIDNTIRVRWDSFRMDQVVENLISNAIKYAKGKAIELTIRQEGENVRIAVRDYGIGISAEDQKRIFKRFERAVSSSHFGGLGLGLYIVSQILEAHHGTISVESQPGEGSTFTVVLPAILADADKQAGSAAS